MNFDVEPIKSSHGQKSFVDIAQECGNVANSVIAQREANIKARFVREIATSMIFY
jgi:hypothetical protein